MSCVKRNYVPVEDLIPSCLSPCFCAWVLGSTLMSARKTGNKVMQFRDAETGRYIANVVDGKVRLT